MKQQLLQKQLDEIQRIATQHLMTASLHGLNTPTMALAEEILFTFDKDYFERKKA